MALAGLPFEDVVFGYGRRPPVLSDLTWVPGPGRRTALLGPNGAGKSTLMALGCGAVRPRAGSVSLNGRAVRRGMVGWMPQQVAPVPGLAAREQVALAGWLQGLSRAEA